MVEGSRGISMTSKRDDMTQLLKDLYPGFSYDSESGILKLGDSRVVMFFADTVVSTQKRIESILGFDTAGMLLYEAYKEAGRTGAEIIRKSLGIERLRSDKHILMAIDMVGGAAWGKWKLAEFDKFTTKFIVFNSPIAELYGESKRAVCHPIRGILAGFAEIFTGQKRECVEFRCKAKGDANCEFAVAAPAMMTKMTLERLNK
jgi:predicted hydrocarbon binding protein